MTSSISFADTAQFSSIFLDYVNDAPALRPFYQYRPDLQSFKAAIADKKRMPLNRQTIVSAIEQQYEKAGILSSSHTKLLSENSFTVCTGHQLCLFTGPLYFIFKIVSTINLARTLQKQFPENEYIPVYWMASEDHDFAEISTVNLFGKSVSWAKEGPDGPVGRIATDSVEPVIKQMEEILGDSVNAKSLVALFREAYLKHDDVASATRYLVHSLFCEQGLVIVDGNDAALKQLFHSVMLDDLKNQTNYKLVTSSAEKLQKLGYSVQVNPRPINLFDISGSERIRIEQAETSIMELPAQSLSPNVVLRPLYQQMILPNLAYVGGPGEIAYWLEFKEMFDHHQVPLPVLMPRNFALISDEKTSAQLDKLGLSYNDLFRDADSVIKDYVTRNAGAELSLASEESGLRALYADLSEKAAALDQSLKGTVEAELQKSINSLKNIESKMIRAEKQKQETAVSQIKKLRSRFLPSESLQERYENFSPYYLKKGEELIPFLLDQFDPFKFEFQIITL
jgi:bacillithiol biosynthesis cysteine-adding enzyme BshC